VRRELLQAREDAVRSVVLAERERVAGWEQRLSIDEVAPRPLDSEVEGSEPELPPEVSTVLERLKRENSELRSTVERLRREIDDLKGGHGR
jgi:hypothetical protein